MLDVLKILKKIFVYSFCNILEVFSNFRRLDENVLVFIPSKREPFSGNCRALFQYIRNNDIEKYSIIYFVDDGKARDLLNREHGHFFYSSTDLSALRKASKAKIWMAYDLPLHFFLLFFLRNRKRIVYYLGHGIPLKRIALASYNISLLKKLNRFLRVSCYTHVLSFSKMLIPVMREAFGPLPKKYIPIGPPINDFILQEDSEVNKCDEKKILYAPTWREDEPCLFFPFSDMDLQRLKSVLELNNIYIFIRPHGKKPYKIDGRMLEMKNIKLFDSEEYPDISRFFHKFDALITDYSSIFFDFLLFDKPIAFIPYDKARYELSPGFSLKYDSLTPGVKIKHFEEFVTFLEDLSRDSYSLERSKAITALNIRSSGNCSENIKLIENMIQG